MIYKTFPWETKKSLILIKKKKSTENESSKHL